MMAAAVAASGVPLCAGGNTCSKAVVGSRAACARPPPLALAGWNPSAAATVRPRAAVVLSASAWSQTAPLAVSVADAKEALTAELDGGKSRPAITELVLALEAQNPTAAPAKSELLQGKWKFAYNGDVAPGLVPSPTRPLALAMYAGGFSPGTFGLTVAGMLPDNIVKTTDFELSIAGLGPFTSTASISVEALGRKASVAVGCALDVESDVRLRETYKSLVVDGQSTEVPASLQYERVMFISYLDADTMIARTETGGMDILTRLANAPDEPPAVPAVEEDMFAADPITSAVAEVAESLDKAVETLSEAASTSAEAKPAAEEEETGAPEAEAAESAPDEAAADAEAAEGKEKKGKGKKGGKA